MVFSFQHNTAMWCYDVIILTMVVAVAVAVFWKPLNLTLKYGEDRGVIVIFKPHRFV